ncbi:MAG TPA: hypothetical protein VKR58_14640, partial [Aquella sp.]|nr:hypothetical protein [Aquella sp.]
MKNAMIIGAGSTIASQVIDKLAAKGFNLYLLARDEDFLQEKKQDMNVKYPNANVLVKTFDAENDTGIILEEKINAGFDTLGTIDVVLIAYGNL